MIFPSFLFGLKYGSDWSGCQGTFQVKKTRQFVEPTMENPYNNKEEKGSLERVE
ncbi:hypothetical protein LFML04_0758 [Leptospirillum ferriphilum ML-04]|uniref:Uncharacterized protein n=1 Tax=Leptospirillum ferriphilum (strain ML-04) TaxID=1048260 RepID=J9ZB73_LEPFM|nr:hypothetical protein LFML04_0758 [Leptospirillum ferriphilum ML-04]